jgi:hypothetical protein
MVETQLFVATAGELVGTNTGANKERLEGALRSQLTPAELPKGEPLFVKEDVAVSS